MAEVSVMRRVGWGFISLYTLAYLGTCLLFLAPVLVTAIHSLRHRRPPGRRTLVVLGLAITGLVLVSSTAGLGETGPRPLLGVVLAVLSGTTYALTTLLAARGAADTAEVASALGRLRAMLDVLGLDPLGVQWGQGSDASGAEHAALDALITTQLAARAAARAEKDWARADELRDALSAAGIRIEDGPDAARWTLDTRD